MTNLTNEQIKNALVIVQEPVSIYSKHLHDKVAKEQKPILQAIVATYLQQTQTQNKLTQQNKVLLNKIKTLEKLEQDNQKYIQEFIAYKEKIENA